MPSAALEFEHLFFDSTEPIEQEEDSDGPHFLETFIADAKLGVALGGADHVVALSKETAVIDRRAEAIYRKIAADAGVKTSGVGAANSLTKRANEKKSVRTEVTKYSSGREVIAEIGEDGSVIHTFMREGNQ